MSRHPRTLAPVKRNRPSELRAAEFFAGIGLVRAALAEADIEVVWANDIEPAKEHLYAANFGGDHFRLDDIRNVVGDDIPDVDVATASFPCTDLSLAGSRRGLAGVQSGMFWEFARVLEEMGDRRPSVVLLENVPGFATSHGGRDLADAVGHLNELGYVCDPFVLNADRWVPQSRERLFIVGMTEKLYHPAGEPDEMRPPWLIKFMKEHSGLLLQANVLEPPAPAAQPLDDYVQRFRHDNEIWWTPAQTAAFTRSLSDVQRERFERLRVGRKLTWRTAYRRTRGGVAVWEMREDPIAGCLRTARGGSSKQAVVELGRGNARVRWMTDREYARLQGVGDEFEFAGLSSNKVMFGFGDAVCVPVVAWIAQHYLRPAVESTSCP